MVIHVLIKVGLALQAKPSLLLVLFESFPEEQSFFHRIILPQMSLLMYWA